MENHAKTWESGLENQGFGPEFKPNATKKVQKCHEMPRFKGAEAPRSGSISAAAPAPCVAPTSHACGGAASAATALKPKVTKPMVDVT